MELKMLADGAAATYGIRMKDAPHRIDGDSEKADGCFPDPRDCPLLPYLPRGNPSESSDVKIGPVDYPDRSFVPPLGGFELPLENRSELSIDIRRLDISISVTQETRAELPPLSETTRDVLRTSGWPEVLIDNMGSEQEAKIYQDAALEPKEVNGKPALVRTDIDPEQKDALGQTNLERMQSGRAPLDRNGNPIELHHVGQKQDSCLAELTRSEHTGGGNDNILHNKRQESTIDREGFAKERAEHWKARAADFETGN